MADAADEAQEHLEREEAARRPAPYRLEPGTPGDCELCGEWSGRLVDGTCAPCRDRMARLRI